MSSTNNSIIVNDKITIRQPLASFAEPIFKVVHNQRAYLREWLPWVDQTKTAADVSIFIEEANAFNIAKKQFVNFIFDENQIIGSISFVYINQDNAFGEIGYWLDQKYQGKGIISECCKKMIEYGFMNLSLNRIEIKMASNNQKSKAIPERLGFIHEGTLREASIIRNQLHNVELYSLLKKEWSNNPL